MATATHKNTPNLRFPEFNGDWELKKLGDIGINIIDGDRGTNYPNGNDFSNEGYCLFMNAKNVTKNGFSFIEKSFITKLKDEKLRKGKLQRFDIVLTTRGSVGHISYYDMTVPFEHLRINSGMVLIRTNGVTINSNYLYKYFNANEIQKEISKISFGSAQPQLTVGEISKFKVNFPTLPEQQKIATFLTAVDEKLQALKQKKNLLEQYKKGVMQQLFSQELRFKDDNGNAFSDWEEKKLGDLTFKVDKKNKENIKYPIYSINNKEGFLPQSDQFEGMDSNDRGYDISIYKVIESNTFAYNPARINVGSIGFSGELSKIIISSLYVCFKTIDSLEDGYLLHYLNTKDFNNSVNTLQEGGVRSYLFYDSFSKITIPLPSNKEQLKIVNFLSSIDEKINQCEAQIVNTEVWKKGLLQKMFV